MQENSITQGSIPKQMILFTIPIMIGTLFQQLYNTVDVIVIGKFVSAKALACVGGSSGMIIFLFIGFFTGLTSGITVVAAKYFGAKDTKNLSYTIHTSIALSILGGILFTILGNIFTEKLLQLLNTPTNLIQGSTTYLRIYFFGLTFQFLFNSCSAILRALGDSKTPLYYLILCCFLNIALDIVLVVIFPPGITGVGIATTFSQLISSIYALRALTRFDEAYKLNIKSLKIHPYSFKEIIQIGFPAALQSLMNSFSGMIMTNAINSLGTFAIAGNTAYAKLDGIYWMVSNAFSVTISTFVAQNIGAKQLSRAKESIKTCLLMDISISAALSLLFFFSSNMLLYLFTNDSRVIAQALLVMKAIAPYYAIVPFYEILASALRGMNITIVPTIINILGLCGIRAIYILCQSFTNIYDIIISCPISWICTAILTILYYKKKAYIIK